VEASPIGHKSNGESFENYRSFEHSLDSKLGVPRDGGLRDGGHSAQTQKRTV